ncbi:MAG: recombinase family protein [Candidatus Dormibacteria bacterium]
MVRAALWLRVSTVEQASENQEPELRDLALARGFLVVRVYRLEAESAYSGAAGYRRALAGMLRHARQGDFSVLLVWALDRLSREGPLATLQLVDRLGRSGVQVISAREPWTEAPGELRELLLAIAAWVARMESQRRSERTLAGLARARAEGKRLGRPPGAKDRRRRRRSGYYRRWAEHDPREAP